MAKPTAAFKMKKSLKHLFHFEHDPHKRGELKRQTVQAQMASEIKVKEKKHRNQPDLEV